MTQEGAITTNWIIPNTNRYLGLSVDGLKTTSLILGIIFLVIFIASVVLLNQTKPAELPLFEKEALAVGKKYADRIAQASSQTPSVDEKIISLGSMEDLVKVADELGNGSSFGVRFEYITNPDYLGGNAISAYKARD